MRKSLQGYSSECDFIFCGSVQVMEGLYSWDRSYRETLTLSIWQQCKDSASAPHQRGENPMIKKDENLIMLPVQKRKMESNSGETS